MSKLKELPITKICDVVIKGLYKRQKIEGKIPFLNKILDEKNIYYDMSTIREIVELLEEKELIEKDAYFFELISFNLHNKKKITSDEKIKKTFEGVDGAVYKYHLTKKGMRFVSSKQKLHPNIDIVNQFFKWLRSNKFTAYFIIVALFIMAVIGFYKEISTFFHCLP